MFINYAHRGASAYAPENTMSAFKLGILLGANGIETDVMRTKDNILVLFHDQKLERLTGKIGKISDFTFHELLDLNVCFSGNELLIDKIPSLETFLSYIATQDVSVALELKQTELEQDVIRLLDKYSMRDKVIITSFDFCDLKRVKETAGLYRIGYLADSVSEETISMLKSINGEQICPHANIITSDLVAHLHARNLSVRAWGVNNDKLMKYIYDCGVDGMTVNFPDLLTEYINRTKFSK